jgi:hypothetical protein
LTPAKAARGRGTHAGRHVDADGATCSQVFLTCSRRNALSMLTAHFSAMFNLHE